MVRGARPAAAGVEADGLGLRELLDDLPPELAAQALAHPSWTARRADSYARLAFLGDAVLALAVSDALHAELDPGRFGAGRLTRIRAQAVSRRACRTVAERLDLPERLRAAAPPSTDPGALDELLRSEGPVAEAMEAVVGACYLAHGYEATAAATRRAYAAEIRAAQTYDADFKSALQERLAQHGQSVLYAVVGEDGPAHDRTFAVAARVGEREVGRGSGRSKKDAEQAAARVALEAERVG